MDENLVREYCKKWDDADYYNLMEKLNENNRDKYPDEAFEAIQRILISRGVNIPTQNLKSENSPKDSIQSIPSSKPNIRFALFFLAGAVLGIIIVRGFFLDPIEEIAWRLFWEGLGRGKLIDAGTVVKSATFAKCIAGIVIGGLAAAFLGSNLQKSTPSKTDDKSVSQNN
ncbi:MAG: hypothetical protein Q8K98_08730 [Bacteroidota bacterium]|nr:hypothetical protein [Bacteroidota bacterium]